MRAHLAAGLIVTMAVLAFLLEAWAHDVPPIAIKVSPQVLFAGDAFYLTCSVRRDARNRQLEYGVVGFREDSERQLDGESAAVTHRMLIEHVPCEAGPAYCAVYRVDASHDRVSAEIVVAGCGH